MKRDARAETVLAVWPIPAARSERRSIPTTQSKISSGKAFSVVGKTGIWKRVDVHRKVKSGESERQLRALADRRDLIAHTGDRRGGGKANIEASEVRAYSANARSIVEALEAVLA